MLVGLVLVDKIYLDLKCLLYKMASNFLQPGVFIIEKRENKKKKKRIEEKKKKELKNKEKRIEEKKEKKK